MKVTSEQFKDKVCIVNRVCRDNTKVSFTVNVYVSKNGKDNFQDVDCKELKSISIKFAEDTDETDELVFVLK